MANLTKSQIQAEITRRKYNRTHDGYKSPANQSVFKMSKTQLNEALASFTKVQAKQTKTVAKKQVKVSARVLKKARKLSAKAGSLSEAFQVYSRVMKSGK